MLVQNLQLKLQHQYDLAIPYEVEQFVSHDAELARHLSGSCIQHPHETEPDECKLEQETVFIRQSSDTLEFTLYLDQEVLNQATANHEPGPEPGHDSSSVDSLCTVVEGVSHAVCLLWHAHHDRQLRPLDLELQAEIDKYLILTKNQCEISQRRQWPRWHQQLFYQISYTAPTGTSLHERYRTANDSAANYCHWLSEQFMNTADDEGLARELARFYRLSGTEKFDRIRQLH